MAEKQGPTRPTKPLQKGGTTPFGDQFMASRAKGASSATRPLPSVPTSNLIAAVSAKFGEIKGELDYIGHLTSLFARPIATMRAAIRLAELKGVPSPVADEALLRQHCTGCAKGFDGAQTAGVCSVCLIPYHQDCWKNTCEIEGCQSHQFSVLPARSEHSGETEILGGLGPEQIDMARAVALKLAGDGRIKQRTQVCLFQYDEAMRAFEESSRLLSEALQMPPSEAWQTMHDLGIERVKGKAYAICGFYENFKLDEPLDQLFPPPRPKGGPASAPTNPGQSGGIKPQATPPELNPVDDDEPLPIEHAIGGLIGRLKGLFK